MTRLSVGVLVVPVILLSPVSAGAQVIRSYESLDRSAGDDYYATAAFLVDGATGNSDFVDMDVSGAVGYRGEAHWVRFYPTYRLKRSEGENIVHDRSAHIRHSFFIGERTRTFAFVQVQAEESIGLDLRFLAGGGIRYRLARFDSGGVDVGVGLMLDEERRVDADAKTNVRGANFLSVHGNVGVVNLTSMTYFQPACSDWSDHRVQVLLSGIVTPLGSSRHRYVGLLAKRLQASNWRAET